MSEQMEKNFAAWIERKIPGVRKDFPAHALFSKEWEGWQAALATQPQAPQGGEITDGDRYQHLRNLPIEAPANGVDVAIWGDHCGESIRGEALDHLIDSEIKALAPTETPEVRK